MGCRGVSAPGGGDGWARGRADPGSRGLEHHEEGRAMVCGSNAVAGQQAALGGENREGCWHVAAKP